MVVEVVVAGRWQERRLGGGRRFGGKALMRFRRFMPLYERIMGYYGEIGYLMDVRTAEADKRGTGRLEF